MPKTLALFASFEVLHTTQYAFHVLTTPKLRQTDSSPRQATFFILEPSKLYAYLKNHTASPSGKRVQHISQSAAVCVDVQQCSEFFAQLLVPSVYHLLVLHWIFWNNANTLLTVVTRMTSLVLGKWLYIFWWTVKTAEQVRNQKFAMRGCYGGVGAELPTLEKFVFCCQK